MVSPETPGSERTQAAEYVWVDTADAFANALHTIAAADRIALDVEGDSLYHYFEKVCLIQISTEQETFIIDPLAIKDLSGLGPIFADGRIEKVLHAAAYDVSSLRRDYGFCFGNLFDTHVAAELLGYERRGLDDLLSDALAIVHSKRRQRDDWSRRPLEPAQLQYAAMDTCHLLRLRDVLAGRLQARGRLPWAEEEFRHAALCAVPEKHFDTEGFLRIKGSRDLSGHQLSVLRSLYLLRDRYARMMDLPPFKVINNPVLIDLARNPPASPGELFRRPGIAYRIARNFSAEIYRTIARGALDAGAPAGLRNRIPAKPFTREAKARLERLKEWRQSKALSLELSIGVVFPGTLLEAIAAAPPREQSELEAIEGMRRWRAREFGGEILAILRAG